MLLIQSIGLSCHEIRHPAPAAAGCLLYGVGRTSCWQLLIRRKRGRTLSAPPAYGSAIYSTNKKLYVKKKDFGRRPKIGNPVTVDEMEYFIQNFDEQAGMYALTIYLRRQ